MGDRIEHVDARLVEQPSQAFQVTKEEAEQMFRVRDAAHEMLAALRVADAAINPPDRGGISMAIWHERLKAATAQIRAAITRATAQDPRP